MMQVISFKVLLLQVILRTAIIFFQKAKQVDLDIEEKKKELIR